MNYKSVPAETDAEIVGCGILTCMAIVTPMILISYLMQGRDVIQSTVIDIAFSFIAAALLMCAGGMACFTYNSVFALSGPPVISNASMTRKEIRVAASMGVTCIGASLIYVADFFWLLMQRSAFLREY